MLKSLVNCFKTSKYFSTIHAKSFAELNEDLCARAFLGEPIAINKLSVLRKRGKFDDPEKFTAIFTALKAAEELGNSTTALGLATCHAVGLGTPINRSLEFAAAEKAADTGSIQAYSYLAYLYKNGNDIIPKDLQKSHQWFLKAAEKGSQKGMKEVAVSYRKGEGTPIDRIKAFTWNLKAAESGFDAVYSDVASCYGMGLGTPRNDNERFKWVLKAAESESAGNGSSYFNAGYCLENGIGTKVDHVEAFKWYEKGAKEGNRQALFNCGFYYEMGLVEEVDFAKALEWYEKAAEIGHVKAQKRCGVFYAKGMGTLKDLVKSEKWFEKARLKEKVDKIVKKKSDFRGSYNFR